MVTANSARAQLRVGSDGRARDASNLVGSNGYNAGGGAAQSQYSNLLNNSIVNGDVTGGKAFRGNLMFEDPTSFHGNLPGDNLSNFISQSSGVTTSGVLTDNANQTKIYLGDSRGVNAPSNFVSLGNNGGYIPSPVLDTPFADGRLGDPGAAPTGDSSQQSLLSPAGTQAGGGRSSYVTASPLYGVKRLDAAQQSTGTSSFSQSQTVSSSALNSQLDDTAMTSRLAQLNEGFNSDLTPGSFANPAQNTAALSGQTSITQQQGLPPTAANASAQLNAGTDQNNPDNSNGANGQNQNGQPNGQLGIGTMNGANGAGNQLGALNNRPLDRPVNAAVPAGNAVLANANDQRLGGSINTGQDLQTNVQNISRVSPTQKTAYYRMLSQLQAQGGAGALTPQQQKMLQSYKAEQQNPDNGDNGHNANSPMNGGRNASSFGSVNIPGSTGAAGATGGMTGAGAGGMGGGAAGVGGAGATGMGATGMGGSVGAVSPSQIPQPKAQQSNIVIPSFAREETNKNVQPLLAKAEELMKQGKFSSAVDQYDQAEQMAPNDSFVWLGRANAELGTTSYGLAEQHLRRAFMADQALMMARYDLGELLGNDRLQYLIKDLKEIAQANPSESRPVFLLAYICYNMNKDRAAANYLNLAAKREGKPDPLYQLLQQRWNLPDVSGDQSELTK